MEKLKLCIGAFCAVAMGGQGLAKPFTVMSGRSLGESARESILFSSGEHLLVRNSDASNDEFFDLYWVNLQAAAKKNIQLAKYGEVLEMVGGEFAVLRLDPVAAEELTGVLHQHGSACGVIFRLYGDTVSQSLVRRRADPVIELESKLTAVEKAVEEVDGEQIRHTVEDLSNIYSRHHQSETGRNVAQVIGEKYQSMASSRADVSVGTFDHGSLTPQASLVVRIEGTTKPDEIIVLGSHIDSINYQGGAAPGADDNASGTATNLEVFRVLIEQGFKFERTIEIHGYAAEEIGLVGSQDIARTYVDEGKNVVAMVQHDMTIYSADGNDKIWFVTNGTNAALTDALSSLTDTYVGMAKGKGMLLLGSSDHAAWHRQGIPAAFPFENPNRLNNKIHSSDDTIANSGAFNQAAGFAKLGLSFLAHYAGLVSE